MDELNHAGDEHLDPVYVEGYDRKASFDPGPDLDPIVSCQADRGSPCRGSKS